MTSSIGRESTSWSAGNGASIESGGQLQQAATGLIDQAARTADAQASTRMTMVGDTIDGIARAIDDASQNLREQQPELADLTSTAATKLQEAATYLRDHSASEALDGVQQYARRQPALVVGGGLLAGLLLGRFLRTGASVAQSSMGQRQLGTGSSAATSYDYRSGGDANYGGGTAYGADMPDELAATDAAALGGSTVYDTDVTATSVGADPIDSLDDLDGGTGETRTGEAR